MYIRKEMVVRKSLILKCYHIFMWILVSELNNNRSWILCSGRLLDHLIDNSLVILVLCTCSVFSKILIWISIKKKVVVDHKRWHSDYKFLWKCYFEFILAATGSWMQREVTLTLKCTWTLHHFEFRIVLNVCIMNWRNLLLCFKILIHWFNKNYLFYSSTCFQFVTYHSLYFTSAAGIPERCGGE